MKLTLPKFIGRALGHLLGFEAHPLGTAKRIRKIGSQKAKLRPKAELADQIFPWVRLLKFAPEFSADAIPHIFDTKSQMGQDLLALMVSGFKREGFFLEIGATDGISLSNSLILERKFGWKGIVVEPSTRFSATIAENRKCKIDSRAVWRESGQRIPFIEVPDTGLSTLASFADSGGRIREGESYLVETVSPTDLLDAHNSPRRIDFVSIDTEGSELEIIREFPFDKYKVSVMCVEHNFNPWKHELDELIESKGFKKVFSEISSVDSWFVSEEIASRVALPA